MVQRLLNLRILLNRNKFRSFTVNTLEKLVFGSVMTHCTTQNEGCNQHSKHIFKKLVYHNKLTDYNNVHK